MNSDFETKWEPTTEYTHMVEYEEQYSQQKLETAGIREQEILNTHAPIIDIFLNMIYKIKTIRKQKSH